MMKGAVHRPHYTPLFFRGQGVTKKTARGRKKRSCVEINWMAFRAPSEFPDGKDLLHVLKKRVLIVVFSLAVLAVAGMIFAFSAQDGISSMKTSDGITYWLIRLTHPGFDQLPAGERNAIYQQYMYPVRKAAHFTEFALLGVFLRLLLNALKTRWQFAISWTAGTLYAVTDEWHQMLLGTRTAMWQDVGIDSAGVLFGVLVVTVILVLRARSAKKKGAPDQKMPKNEKKAS